MKKFIFIITFLLCLFLFSGEIKAYYDCSQYGLFAYSDGLGYCKCMSGYVWGIDYFGKKKCVSGTNYCYDKYGYGSEYNSLTGKCKCSNGYVWDSDVLGNKLCISCFNKYGLHSTYNYLSDNCECMSGYFLKSKIYGGYECISGDDLCEDDYGIHADYNSLTDKCECNYGYEFTLKKIGSGLECVRCSTKYGINSSYNSLTKKCECDDDYTLGDDGKCVEKQNNVYFILKEVNTNERKAIIKSEYDFKYYFITYSSYCYPSTIKRYLNNQIVVNLGTDYKVDIGDNIVLFDDDEVCNINSVKKVNSSFTLAEKDERTSFYYIPQKIEKVIIEGYSNSFLDNSNVIAEEKSLITKIDKKLSKRVSGNILLQVEKNGEGWYVSPDNQKKYYLGRPSDAFSIMRKLGLGATHKFITENTIFPDHVLGKILLDVEQNGEAYYIYPKDKKAYYLGRPADAFSVMRNLGLGITDDNIRKIDVGEVE